MGSISSTILRFGSVLALGFCLSSAQATLIDFTGAPEGGVFSNPTGSVNGPSLYISQGFEFRATGTDGHFHVDNQAPDSLLMHTNLGSIIANTWVLSRTGSGEFDLTSFDMIAGASPLNWITDLGGSGATSSGVNTVNLSGIHSFTFSLQSPSGVASVGNFVVDANSVPEPETLALVLGSLGVMGVVTRRRKPVDVA
jgi:hypothetical protein